MSLVDRIKEKLEPESEDVYRCENCEEVIEVESGEAVEECPNCGSDDLTLITRG